MIISIDIELRNEHLEIIDYIFNQNRDVHRKEINYLLVMDLLREGILAKNKDHYLWLTYVGKKIYHKYKENNK